jgi:hypothetical protein
MPQEREFLQRAAEAYRQALNLYLSIKDFSNVSSNIRLTQQALNRVDQRLAELSAPPVDTVPSLGLYAQPTPSLSNPTFAPETGR